MDAADLRGLTKLSFRRDVRLFLTILVGILIALIFVLVMFLGRAASEIARAAESHARASTRAAAALVELHGQAGTSTLAPYLIFLRSELGIDAIAFVPKSGGAVSSGHGEGLFRVEHPAAGGTLICYFDLSAPVAAKRTFLLTTIICIGAVIAGSILLFLYLPRITGPVEALLDQARLVADRAAHEDETEYLIATFRNTVSALRAREKELERLHAAQKSRADDLERVTAALTRSLSSGFIAVDPEGRIVDANAAAREILDAGNAELTGRSVVAAFGSSEFTRMLEQAVRERAAISRAEARADTGDKEQVIGLTTVPLIGDEQTYLGTLAIFTDLTPIRRLEEMLRESRSLADLGEISAGIAHEFRNSLSTILGYLRLAKRGDSATAIDNVEREANALSEAVSALLAFARPMTIESHPVDLLDVTNEAVGRIAGDDVPVSADGEHVIVQGDAVLLRTAIENLLRNAVDSVRQKGSGSVEVRVSASPHPSIAIADSGVGVDPADAPKLFLPFQSRKPQGYGLGLPLAKKIAFLHGATLRLSGSPGIGATATIDFVPGAGG